MVQKNELRIGNYVDFNGELAKISQLWDKETIFKCGDSDLYENLNAIPLTEELLLKCGFEKSGMAYVNSMFVIDKWSDGRFWYGHRGGSMELKHLHQLQNLYFALINKEVEIKL
jgi:hypothetical protein